MTGRLRTRTLVLQSILFAVLLLVCALLLSGCGGDDVKVDPKLRSAVSAPFQEKTVDGKRYVVGHAVAFTVPDGWVDYGDEQTGQDSTTWEWAIGLPEDTLPLPAGLQLSMGRPDRGVQFKTLPQGAKELAEGSPGYKLLDEGKVEVPGAEHASYLRFERDLPLASGSTVHVEQVSLFIEVEKGVTSTIRFIAAAGDWSNQMKATYDSVVVAKGSDKGDDA